MRRNSFTAVALWALRLGVLLVTCGCEPLYQSYTFTEPVQTTFPVQVNDDDVWVTSVPVGADVYVEPYDPERVPSHATSPDAYRGKTPLGFSLSPGTYWIEVASDAQVFENYFAPPYDRAQFEQEGAFAEALLFRPFAPGDRRRLLRYYKLEKHAQQGQTLIALFHPRGEPLERVAALYPQQEHYQVVPEELRTLLQQAQVPANVQDAFITLLRRGGKAFWSLRDEYRVAFEVQPGAVQGRVVVLYTGAPLAQPLIPDR